MRGIDKIGGDRGFSRLIFLPVFAAELAYGVYLGFQGVLLGDAVSRTANAYYVLNVRPYRFASMGLVWNPLPSTLQLPFVALAKLWKPFVTKGVGAACVSALFAAWSASILLDTFLRMKVPRPWALAFTLLIALQPYIFFYGANGMSEMISFAFTVMIVCNLTLWMRQGAPEFLVRIAVGFAGLFLTRYESIPFAAAVGLSVATHILFSRRERRYHQGGGRKEAWFYIEGTMILVFAPMAYAALMWLLYNWVISGNPLYFLNSGYSMLAYSAYYTAYGGPAEVLGFLWARTWPFLTMTGAILAVRLVRKQLWRPDTLIFLMCALVLTAFQFVMLMNGSSAGYVRYMCYPLLICCAWLPYELAPRDPAEGERALSGPGARRFYAAALIALGVWFGWAFQNDEIIREDTLFLLPEGSTQMADYINSRLPESRILMDAYRAYYVFMSLDNPDSVVISSSLGFYESLADPAAHGVEYIMVPESGSYGDMDAVNIAYRSLYYGGAPWCEEVASIGEFKLFRVTDSVQGAANGGSYDA
jgi:hypothetical protein